MRIAMVGATGNVGGALLEEALARGHEITALVRSAGRLPARAGLREAVADVRDPGAVARAVAGLGAAVSAFSPGRDEAELRRLHVDGFRTLVQGLKQAGVPRLLVVGGAGSLEVAPGVQLVDSAGFPDAYRETALATRDVLGLLREERELEWTFLSPPAELVPGPRTGRYRLGGDALLVDGEGKSRITLADYAAAMIDELERPRHPRRRFTVAA